MLFVPTFRSSAFVTCLASALMLSTACERDPGQAIDGGAGEGTTGRLRVELTDAPLDDPGVEGVYLTFAGISLDGEPLENFSARRTVDISNYRAGRTLPYGPDEVVRAGTYEGLTLSLDLQRDASGETPGAYLTDGAGAKTALDYGDSEARLRIPTRFAVVAGELTELVLDVDLRRAVRRREGGGYTLGSEADLTAAVRLVNKRTAGSVEGEVTNHGGSTREGLTRVVYVFARGGASLEAVRADDFSGAITSTTVDEAGRFRLSYLPSGDYELLVADFADQDGDGAVELAGVRVTDAVVGAAVREMTVSAGAQVQVEVELGGML